MKVTVLGIGNMGNALGRLWLRKHQVCFTHSREPEKLRALKAALPGAHVTSDLAGAIRFGEVVMLATPYAGLDEIFRYADEFEGKVVISCVSNLVPDFTGSTIGLPTGRNISVAEEIAQKLPRARVVEAFNISFAENLKLPIPLAERHQPTVFYCGDDLDAKRTVVSLIEDCDYDAKNAGPLISSRSQETLATAWVQFAVASGLYPHIAFKALLV